MDNWVKTLVDFFTIYGLQVLGAAIIFALGCVAAVWAGRLLGRWLEKKGLDLPVRTLMVRLLRLLIIVFTVITALAKLAVDILPLIAGLSVVGVGVGLAAQGVLGNVVAGLTIIFTKPFRIGDYIQITSVEGQVENIELFSTTLVHADLSRVVVPNRKIVGEILHNYGTMRQLQLTVPVAYESDVAGVIASIRDILLCHPQVLKEPAPVVGVEALAESSINLSVKPWVLLADYGPAQADLYEKLVNRFRETGVSMPFPQREVRLLGAAPTGLTN